MRALEDFTNRGIFVNVDGTYDYQSGSYHYTMEMTVEGRADNNDTSVSCMVYDTGTPVESSVAYVYIAGPPLAPGLKLAADASRLTVSWECPFSFDIAEVTSYKVSVRKNDGSTSQTINDTEFTIVQDEVASQMQQCNEVTFGVSAVNKVGESPERIVTGGFTIAIDPNSAVAAVDIQGGRATITPPHMCSYQEANYTIVLEDSGGSTVVTAGPFTHKYSTGRPFTVDLKTHSLSDGEVYKVKLMVDPLSEALDIVEFEDRYTCCGVVIGQPVDSNQTETIIKTKTITTITSKGPNPEEDATTTLVTETVISTITAKSPDGTVTTTTTTTTTTTHNDDSDDAVSDGSGQNDDQESEQNRPSEA